MREPASDHCSSHYDRPNQQWVCGLEREGQACPAGPTASGRCPALPDCTPMRDGDRWRCNRSQLRGGPCDAGPTPEGACGQVQHCQPRRSLRAVRGRFISACGLLTAGLLVIMLSADWRNEIIAPGPLARSHAQLLNRTGTAANCAACHGAAAGGPISWAATIVVGHGGQTSQSQLCMKCHGKTINNEFATTAHNVSPETLQAITAAQREDTSVSTASARSNLLACATCHREHHGSQYDLTAIANDACQACHRRRYESFASDHPEFGIWPYQRRTRIAFNHASHSAKYFAEKNQRFDCAACHMEDATHAVQLSPSYETACAGCHDEKIATSVAQGVPMLVLPTLDVESLEAAGHIVRGWPEAAIGDFDGRLPTAMKLLLSADPAAAQAMHTFGEDFEFLDIDPGNPEHLAACAELAGAIQRLFVDLATSGEVAARERLPRALGRQVTEAESNALVAGLSLDTLRGAAAAWLSGSGNVPAPPQGNNEERVTGDTYIAGDISNRPLAYAPAGTWFRDDAALTVRYRPAAHADPVLASWLDALVQTPDLAGQPLALAAFKELSHATAPGLCITCHSAEQSDSGKLVINWRAYDRANEPRGFTKFSHGPHVVLPQLADCTQCHAIDQRATAAAHAGWDPHRFASEFLPMSKSQCAECHTATAAGDRCQSCHNYHVEGSGLSVEGQAFTRLAKPEP